MSDQPWLVQCFLDGAPAGERLDVRELPLALALTDEGFRFLRWTRAFAGFVGGAIPGGPDGLPAVLTASGVPDAGRRLSESLDSDQDVPLRVGGVARSVRLRGHVLSGGNRLWILTDGRPDKPRDEFQSLIAHDLRSPLAVIQGYAGLLATGQPGPLNDTQREFLGGIDAKIVEVTRLLDDFLDYGRLEAGALELRCVPVCVDDVVARVLDESSRRAGARNIRLAGDVQPVSLHVDADPLRLHQIIDNLVSNAIKYNDVGGWVRVEARRTDGAVAITVSDGGPGLAPEDRACLFEPFGRGGASGHAEGTGLGLVVVRRLVEMHGGEITVTSAPGAGSDFRVTLPPATSDEGAEAAHETANAPAR